MDLEVLARGDVQDFLGVFFGHVGQHFHLFGRQPTEGDFDPHHARGVPDCVWPLGLMLGEE